MVWQPFSELWLGCPHALLVLCSLPPETPLQQHGHCSIPPLGTQHMRMVLTEPFQSGIGSCLTSYQDMTGAKHLICLEMKQLCSHSTTPAVTQPGQLLKAATPRPSSSYGTTLLSRLPLPAPAFRHSSTDWFASSFWGAAGKALGQPQRIRWRQQLSCSSPAAARRPGRGTGSSSAAPSAWLCIAENAPQLLCQALKGSLHFAPTLY